VKKRFKLSEGLNNCTNEQYHGDKSYISSSGLKLLLKDPALFYDEIILGKKESKHIAAFDEGSYAHTLILEPHMVDQEYSFFPEWRKAGEAWTAFKEAEENQGKIILSVPQRKRVEGLIEAYSKRKCALDLISGGFPEYTVAGEINGVRLKARADYINIDKGYIADVKTTGYSSELDTFSFTVDRFSYELSAALYAMMFERHFGKPFDFYFIVLSKKEKTCDVFKASEDTMERGKMMVYQALATYQKCLKAGVWGSIAVKEAISDDEYEIQEV
jgi:exodeoxyribonuclease VIII